MFFNYYDGLKCKDKVKKLYFSSFLKEERFPFRILEECSKKDTSRLYSILDNERFIGMCYIVNCDDSYYLMYLAVESELRNKNYGSKILKDLKQKYKTLFLSIDMAKDEISIRRKNFYLRNGFYDTNKYYQDNGVWYEVLCTNKKYEITNKIMQKRYKNMTDDAELSNVISNTFNVNMINLKQKYNNKI